MSEYRCRNREILKDGEVLTPAEVFEELTTLTEEMDRLKNLLIERDGGAHDSDCKELRNPPRGCTCGHTSVVAAINPHKPNECCGNIPCGCG